MPASVVGIANNDVIIRWQSRVARPGNADLAARVTRAPGATTRQGATRIVYHCVADVQPTQPSPSDTIVQFCRGRVLYY